MQFSKFEIQTTKSNYRNEIEPLKTISYILRIRSFSSNFLPWLPGELEKENKPIGERPLSFNSALRTKCLASCCIEQLQFETFSKVSEQVSEQVGEQEDWLRGRSDDGLTVVLQELQV